MSQNVGNSHNPFVSHLNLTTTPSPQKKGTVFDQNLPQYPLQVGPGAQTNPIFPPPNEKFPDGFAGFRAWLATELNEIKSLRTQLF